MMAEPENEPVPDPSPQPAPLPEPEQPPPPPGSPEQPRPSPTEAKQRTVGGVHDLSDHPAVLSGQVLNAGDTALNRDPNASNFNRPVLSDGATAEQNPPVKRGSKAKG